MKNGPTVAATATAKAADDRSRVVIKTVPLAADDPQVVLVSAVPVSAAPARVARDATATATVPVVRVADRRVSISATSAMIARVTKPRPNRRNSTPALRPRKKASNPSPARSR